MVSIFFPFTLSARRMPRTLNENEFNSVSAKKHMDSFGESGVASRGCARPTDGVARNERNRTCMRRAVFDHEALHVLMIVKDGVAQRPHLGHRLIVGPTL